MTQPAERASAAPAFHSAKQPLVSFDGSTRSTPVVYKPDRYRFFDGLRNEAALIARGAGLSYTAASFGDKSVTIDHTRFDRCLALDATEQWVEVEAGITLGALYNVLSRVGCYLATQPGHPAITVGGCIAADVHGKNQYRDGTFSDQVLELTLFHPRHGRLTLSRQSDPELFELTCGGYGLTGNILSAKLRIVGKVSDRVLFSTVPLERLDDLVPQVRQAALRSEFVFTWHNFMAKGERFGSGFIQQASFASRPTTVCAPAPDGVERPVPPLDALRRGAWLPPLFNAFTVPPFTGLYGMVRRHWRRSTTTDLYDSLFPIVRKQAYFQLFGQRGFLEYQAIIPFERVSAFLQSLGDHLAGNPAPITLASAKLFRGVNRLLRFSGEGICLALNVPRTGRAIRLFEFLDRLVLETRSLPNLIKDSRLSQAVVAAAYPGYEEFRARLRAFDPQRTYRSNLSERLEL